METCDVEELINDAVCVNASGLDQSHIRIAYARHQVPRITTEKHKVLQILVNLISNAKHAMSTTQNRERVLTVGSRVVDGANVEISVKDNGAGIAKENLRKIFQHGFTTRTDGHGFGLHASAIAATQMHGSLTVNSDGIGSGATFCLTIPIAPPGGASSTTLADPEIEAESGVVSRKDEEATA
jgi:signal transduction histidine kinase